MATPDSKPNPEQVTRIKIVTWNSKTSPDGLQNKLSDLLFSRIPKALVCEQEVTEDSIVNTSLTENLDNSYHNELEKEIYQAVYIPKSGSVYVTDCDDSEIPCDVCDLSKLRCSGKRVTHKQTKKSFILVSFHGEYNRTQGGAGRLKDTEKYDKLKSFINEMIGLANHYKLVVIVGGNFNYEVVKWKTDIEDKYRHQVVVAPLYAGVPNRRHAKDVIDTFIAVYPDKNVVTCKFDTPIPICMLPTTGYIGDDETKFVNYPNNVRPFCKVLYYNNEDLQTLETLLSRESLEKPYKDNKVDIILPLWPNSESLSKFNHDPVMVTIELIPQQVSV